MGHTPIALIAEPGLDRGARWDGELKGVGQGIGERNGVSNDIDGCAVDWSPAEESINCV
jgi:hypothetical protein